MKKTTARALTMLTAAVLGLTGCTAGTNANSGGGKEGETVLTMSAWAGDAMGNALVKQFEKDNPGVTIKYTGLPFPGILTQINTQLVSGTASDIVVAFPGDGNPLSVQTLAKGNYLANLKGSAWVSNYNKTNQSLMGANGKILFGSNAFTIIPAIYNTQALAEVGAKKPPTTFSEVLDLCDAAKAHGKVAYALSALAGGNYTSLGYALAGTLVYGKDPDFVSKQQAGKATFSDSGWSVVFDRIGKMRDAGCFTADATGTAIDVAQGQVASGAAVGTIDVTPAIGAIEKVAPKGSTFQTAPFPATDHASDTRLPVGFGAGYAVNAKSKHEDLAKKFVDFYMSQAGLKVALKSGSIYPSTPVNGYTPPKELAGVNQQAQGKDTVPLPDQTWPNANVTQVYSDGFQSFYGGQSTAKDVLKRMDEAYKG